MEQAYYHDRNKTEALLFDIIRQNSTEKALGWLQEQKEKLGDPVNVQRFNLTFSAIPRFAGRQVIQTEQPLIQLAEGITLFIHGYTLDRLVRLWWLLHLPATDRSLYVKVIEGLFDAADMNELAALYSALPLLAWPDAWIFRTTEGIRSNIGPVQEAVMLHNVYPARHLEEPAWNQLVMKAFFTDKPIHLIAGLDERANSQLAAILTDYAHERWAAGRKVHPLLWRLVGPFITEENFADIQRVWHSEVNTDREAAALACASSTYAPARELLEQSATLKEEIAGQKVTWETIAARIA
ncbi:EboA domain-containing protein [Chitinophaga rhizophila]|uniref:EboA domain-containing protein n=1 Tax=Chitinophaga rhizophila TaxID=2866212 RepID=A0ABS7GL95_9BACT|nr:EboA domain-containing protein [Chitinophaga rhizophila]MBW8688096.1 EboA domain-containing protein [Chitinophaga rhizophila]